jgi:transcriptional regulator with XRE-family HTH domain
MMARTNSQQKLGKAVKTLRLKLGLSQEDLAELTKLDRTYISGIERGIRNPSLKNIEKMAKALGVKISDLTQSL